MSVDLGSIGAARPSSVRDSRATETGRRSALGIFSVLSAEFRRASAAAQRYDDLRYGRAGTEGITDLPRQVFEDFYLEKRP
jgi:hypothetical protein